MNYISSQNLKATIKDLKSSLKSDVDLVKVRQIIKSELTNLLGKENFKGGVYQGGLNKQELLTYLEEFIGKSNSLNKVITSAVEELFDKSNFKNGKFTGGWNEQQDTSNIHKVFKPENFTNGEYTGGWNKSQDQQNLKQSLTDGEAKTITSQIIEQKFGGSEKFQEGVYQSEEIIIKVAEKALENKGPLLRKLRNIMGEKEFFPEEPGDGIPPGREGMRVDPEAIALQQAEQKARIDAIERWREFYEDHGIVGASEKLFWSDKYGSNVKTAEGVYKDAILKAAEMAGEDKPLNDLEKNQINKATTPDKIKEVLENIPKQRRAKDWNNFFEKHDLLNNIDPVWQDNWKKGNLSIEVAKLIYNNGWYNNPDGLIGDDKKIETYTTETTVKGKGYKKTINKIDPLKHLAPEVKKAHDFIVQRIDLETDLSKFPTDEEIGKNIYDEKQIPDTINYEELKNLKHKRIVELFKQYFQSSQPTKLDDKSIELWRTSPTGLPNTGKDQRIAFDNGWTDPTQIQEAKTNYQGITNIEILKVNKVDIDNEITKVDNLVKQINNYQFLRDLDANQASIDKQFQELKTNLLPSNKPQQITEAVKKQRENLYYSLTDPADGGLEETALKKLASNLRENAWQSTNYEPITTKMLNEFIAADKNIQELGLFKEGAKWEDLTESGWLKQQGGYIIPEKHTNAENNLHISQRGSHLLKFFYEKCKDGNNRNFEPGDLNKGTSFCRIGGGKGKRFKKGKMYGGTWEDVDDMPMIGGDKGMAGHLAIGTGVGKTTKLINCLVKGGEKHVILVCPTVGLVDSAVGHHTSWLQTWGCAYHGGKGETEMAICLKDTFTKATDQEIIENKAEKEKKTIFKSHGTYPVAKNDLAYWLNANTGQKEGKEEGKKGLSIMYFGNLLGFAARNLFVESKGVESWSDNSEKQQVKQKLIPKEDTIIVFDEAHFNNAGYQALQFEMINAGFNTTTNTGEYSCLRMSATFPKTEFSATSSYPMKRMFSGRLDPNMPAGLMRIENIEQAEKLADLRGVGIEEIKWKDEKGSPIPVEVNLEERLQAGTTWFFAKNLQLNSEQLRALGSNVKYTIYSADYDENCEDVSHGQPKGSLGIVDGRREMGYTPGIDTVISSGATETTNLQKYFTYSEPVLGFTPISSLVQQNGRVGRIRPGLAITLTKECMEMDISDNVSAAMVKATFDGNTKQIKEKAYEQIYDINILRGALAHPSPLTFGKAPEEILMGLKITPEQVSKKAPIDKLVWRTEADKDEAMAIPTYIKALAKIPGFGSILKEVNPSEELWDRYIGKSEKVTMGEEAALKTLKEMIANFITQDKLYPYGLELKNQAKFLSTVFGTKLEKGNKNEIIEETRSVLNGLVKTKVGELNEKDYDEANKCSKNPNTIKKLVGLYKLTAATIDYQKMKNDEGKMVWTLLMNAAAA